MDNRNTQSSPKSEKTHYVPSVFVVNEENHANQKNTQEKPYDKAGADNYSNQLNPNNEKTGPVAGANKQWKLNKIIIFCAHKSNSLHLDISQHFFSKVCRITGPVGSLKPSFERQIIEQLEIEANSETVDGFHTICP